MTLVLQTMSVECPPGVVAGHVEQSLSIFTPTYIIKVSTTVTEAGNKISNIVKLREREGQGVDPGRSLNGHLWMVDGGWWISFP